MRPGRPSPFLHLPPTMHTHTHRPDTPAAARSSGEQPQAPGGATEGGRAAWNLAIFDRNGLGAAEGRGLSLTLACCPSRPSPPSQGDPLTPPGQDCSPPHPLSPVPRLPRAISALPWLLPAFSPPRGAGPSGAARSSTLSKADSWQGPAGAVAGAGSLLPYLAQPRSRIAT